MKKRLAIAGVIAAVLALCALGTLAYFTAEGRATNVITTGTVELTLHEMQQGADGQLAEYPDEPITGVMPGQSVSKIPYVENSGSQSFYTRVKVAVTVTGADGAPLSGDVVSLNVDARKWLQKDGWYYCAEPVASGEENRVALFDTVTFAADMGNAYQNCTVAIDIEAQAVQVKNNPIPAGGTVLDVQGWPAAA